MCRIVQWENTLQEQRTRVKILLNESPSLKHELSLKLAEADELSLFTAVKETRLSKKVFPEICPFTLDQCLRPDVFPKDLAD